MKKYNIQNYVRYKEDLKACIQAIPNKDWVDYTDDELKVIFLPLVEFFGVNPYFFAMLIALNLQTSFLTPPMAMSAYYLKGVQTKNVELLDIFRGIMPFLGIVIFAMVLMYLFPGIALWLPDTLFAN